MRIRKNTRQVKKPDNIQKKLVWLNTLELFIGVLIFANLIMVMVGSISFITILNLCNIVLLVWLFEKTGCIMKEEIKSSYFKKQ